MRDSCRYTPLPENGSPLDGVRRYRRLRAITVIAILGFAFQGIAATNARAEGLLSRLSGVGQTDDSQTGSASAERRAQVIASLPMHRLTASAQKRIMSIVNSPTIYRQLPTQAIACDRDLFLFVTRNPEVLVGMWDVMGVTQVETTRTGPYQIDASDGSGTTCQMDLVYGDRNLHIFVADGYYDGKMVAKPIQGSGVFVFRSTYAKSADDNTTVTGTLDCFVQFDSLGADLIARGLSGFIGRSADANFIETARFLSQISEASKRNPHSMIDLAQRLPQVSPETRKQFVEVIIAINRRDMQSISDARTASTRTE
ncbi:hypothetical protein [Novipirellula aureliae]|uniref:hypothetical protein n=1 Tax=Novipirellula aureliae TaxID=2527966 RepID=UPI0011B85A47|nr:hypothetical protein [Novipirellula aureliae]